MKGTTQRHKRTKRNGKLSNNGTLISALREFFRRISYAMHCDATQETDKAATRCPDLGREMNGALQLPPAIGHVKTGSRKAEVIPADAIPDVTNMNPGMFFEGSLVAALTGAKSVGGIFQGE